MRINSTNAVRFRQMRVPSPLSQINMPNRTDKPLLVCAMVRFVYPPPPPQKKNLDWTSFWLEMNFFPV